MRNVILVSMLCAFLLLGCTSQPPVISSDSPNVTAPPKPPAQNTTVKPPEPPTSQPASQALLSSLKSAQLWSATYSITDSGLPGVSTISQYVRNGEVRIDMNAATYKVRTYLLGQKAYSCTDRGAGWFCNSFRRELYEGEPIPSDLLYSLGTGLSAQPELYNIAGDGKMAIAGASADCYSLTGANATIKYCVSAKGVPLYMKYGSTNGKPVTSVISATQVGIATDADFVLPAAPK